MIVKDIQSQICKYMSGRSNNETRYASFDLCYEYFYYNKGNLTGGNLQTSCCQLWAYLASWGMIARGNELQGKSYASLIGVVQYINKHPEFYDLKIEDNDYIKKMLNLYKNIDHVLNFTKQKNKKILITKIILGVYACCPALDSRFCNTFGLSTQSDLKKKDLETIQNFYSDNSIEINKICITTLSFGRTKHKGLPYSVAKIIDMYGFMRNRVI